jgi:phage gp36-like protein
MTYAVQADMVQRFTELEIIQLTDRETNLGVINVDVLDGALQDADAEIDGYIGAKVTLPLTSVPKILVGYACDIARYKLYADDPTENVRNRYKDAISFLSLVGQGKLSLGVTTDNEPVTAAGGVKASTPDQVFNTDSMAGF